MAERPTDERIATLEEQVKELSKIDILMGLVNDVKFSISNMRSENKDNFMQKSDCKAKCLACDERFIDVKKGQKKLMWSAIGATISFILFLLQQLLNIQIKLGGS